MSFKQKLKGLKPKKGMKGKALTWARERSQLRHMFANDRARALEGVANEDLVRVATWLRQSDLETAAQSLLAEVGARQLAMMRMQSLLRVLIPGVAGGSTRKKKQS